MGRDDDDVKTHNRKFAIRRTKYDHLRKVKVYGLLLLRVIYKALTVCTSNKNNGKQYSYNIVQYKRVRRGCSYKLTVLQGRG